MEIHYMKKFSKELVRTNYKNRSHAKSLGFIWTSFFDIWDIKPGNFKTKQFAREVNEQKYIFKI